MERNHLVDGWRGLSITLVIIGHLLGFHFSSYIQLKPFHLLLPNFASEPLAVLSNVIMRPVLLLPTIGVNVFFIISGYLITMLLLREESVRGVVSISAFYIRRACRILPAFYVFLLIMFTLSSYGVVNVPVRSFLISGSFLCDLRNAGCTWWLGHTWTLAVEEQFYLVWPIIFIVLSGRSRSIFLVLMLAVLAAVSLLYPIAVSFMHIALGSLFASSAVMRRTISRYAKMRTVTAATSFIFLQSFLGSQPIVLWLSEVIGAAALTWIVFGTINGRSPFLQIVSMETFRRIGLISYSLYLWQQLATGASDWDRAYVVPILLIVPAILSYALIERPLIKVGHRLSRSIMDDRGEIPSQRAIPRNQPDYRLGPQ